MLYQATQYLKFLIKSTNQHGVHSPFVFNLVTKCFYNKTKYKDYKTILHYKKLLLKNKSKIKTTDLGAGSQVMKQQIRSISNIAKNAGTSNKRAKLLFRITKYFSFETILELGTSLGVASHAISLGYPKSNITTIEGCPNISKFAKTNLKKYHVKNTHVISGNFNDTLNTLTPNTYDFIFFDGNHQKDATLNYFETLIKTTHNDSVFIFDDIYWSKDMTEAWEIIKSHPKVSVTIDTFFWGFVFFRKEQVKEHFTIRL
ncbi:methyltransferase [Pseudalgibacter alginicilyticus]|uniref:Methyltransferase n=1 Tax=Pseudalgibacter alginicilyticus TaxID=1736674 RepID=A0A0P0CF24_9FLAO|nr:class I SAM-dependent methyltransferase [Pseudalgibacter alginicilyticus]ALJ04610.1 methyltransferase [Pseudalgibacter alginicilyticus]